MIGIARVFRSPNSTSTIGCTVLRLLSTKLRGSRRSLSEHACCSLGRYRCLASSGFAAKADRCLTSHSHRNIQRVCEHKCVTEGRPIGVYEERPPAGFPWTKNRRQYFNFVSGLNSQDLWLSGIK